MINAEGDMNKTISMYKNMTHHQHHRYNEKHSCLHFGQLAFSRSVKSSTSIPPVLAALEGGPDKKTICQYGLKSIVYFYFPKIS